MRPTRTLQRAAGKFAAEFRTMRNAIILQQLAGGNAIIEPIAVESFLFHPA